MKKLRFSGRAAVVCSIILAIGIPSVAMGFGEGRNMLLGKRNPSNNPSLALSTETEIIANNSTYGTRQSNKKDGDGGGAIYGCRSSLGNEPCVRAVQPQGRPRVRVHHRRRRGRPHRDRQHRPARRSRPTPRASRPASTPTASTARRRPTSPPRPTSPRSPAACSSPPSPTPAVGDNATLARQPRRDRRHRERRRLHGHVQQGREQVLVHGHRHGRLGGRRDRARVAATVERSGRPGQRRQPRAATRRSTCRSSASPLLHVPSRARVPRGLACV